MWMFSNKIMGVVSAKYVAPLKVELHFNDGIIKTVDVGAFIRKERLKRQKIAK